MCALQRGGRGETREAGRDGKPEIATESACASERASVIRINISQKILAVFLLLLALSSLPTPPPPSSSSPLTGLYRATHAAGHTRRRGRSTPTPQWEKGVDRQSRSPSHPHDFLHDLLQRVRILSSPAQRRKGRNGSERGPECHAASKHRHKASEHRASEHRHKVDRSAAPQRAQRARSPVARFVPAARASTSSTSGFGGAQRAAGAVGRRVHSPESVCVKMSGALHHSMASSGRRV